MRPLLPPFSSLSSASPRQRRDFAALGIDPAKAKLHVPGIPGFQQAAQFEVGKPITLPPDGGLILVLESTGQ